jgi:hypothetical protein
MVAGASAQPTTGHWIHDSRHPGRGARLPSATPPGSRCHGVAYPVVALARDTPATFCDASGVG